MGVKLSLHTQPDVPLEADIISADKLAGLSVSEIEKQVIQHGNRTQLVADFFSVENESEAEDTLIVEGDLSRVKHLGADMRSGIMKILGDVGAHLGAGMCGGEIIVEGNAGDWVAPEMTGGRVRISGNAGHLVGSAYRGSPTGMLGGEIIIHGNVKNETGHAMRNGMIVIGGNSGDFTGVNMLAGTIMILGEPGMRTGAGMTRGTIVSMNPLKLLPTFNYSCIYEPAYLRLYMLYLLSLGLDIDDEQIRGRYARWCGDAIELNRGEILLYHSP